MSRLKQPVRIERDPDEGPDLAPCRAVVRLCLRCNEPFPSQHRFNRMCHQCARVASTIEVARHGISIGRES